SDLLGHTQHLGGLGVGIAGWRGLLRRRWWDRWHHRSRGRQRAKVTPGVGRRGAQLLIELVNPAVEIVNFLEVPSHLGTNEVEEAVHLLFAVATLANRRLAERDVVNIGGGQWHRITSGTSRVNWCGFGPCSTSGGKHTPSCPCRITKVV